MKKWTLALLVLSLLSLTAKAVPAYPYPITAAQPDGSTVTLRMHGDEWHHYTTTADGYTVVRNAQGAWAYAALRDEALVATSVLAHDAAQRTPAEKGFLATVSKNLQPPRAAESSAQQQPAQFKLHGFEPIDMDKFRGLVILVNYSDRKFLSAYDNHALFNRMINEQGFSGFVSDYTGNEEVFTGSVRDYFRDQSGGRFNPEFDVVGPIEIDFPQTTPDGGFMGTSNWEGWNYPDMLKAILKAAADSVDYSRYDANGDGVVDLVYFIVAGGGSNIAANNERFLWPHAWTFQEACAHWVDVSFNETYNGMTFCRYACSTELEGPESANIMGGPGTICHEFSHVLTLPDLYSTTYSTSNHPQYWSIMAAGSYLNKGRTPPNYSAYERYALGWLTPRTVGQAEDVTLMPLAETNEALRINSKIENEFFLLENRPQSGWDAYLPGHGMLVWRVDSTNAEVWENNQVNANANHQMFELIRSAQSNYQGSASDPFPGSENVTELLNAPTSPTIRSWTGKRTPWTLKNIAENDGVITFNTVADNVEDKIYHEPFEAMPLTSSDTTGVQGVFSKWNLTKAVVCQPESGLCNGERAIGMLNKGELWTTDPISNRTTDVSFRVSNPTNKSLMLRMQYSTNNGESWQVAKTLENGSLLATIGAGDDATVAFAIGTIERTPLLFKISVFTGSSTDYAYIDDVVVNCYDEDILEGDVNGDGAVNVSDVTALVNMILGVIPKDEETADVNKDGKVNVSDVTALINIILGVV